MKIVINIYLLLERSLLLTLNALAARSIVFFLLAILIVFVEGPHAVKELFDLASLDRSDDHLLLDLYRVIGHKRHGDFLFSLIEGNTKNIRIERDCGLAWSLLLIGLHEFLDLSQVIDIAEDILL